MVNADFRGLAPLLITVLIGIVVVYGSLLAIPAYIGFLVAKSQRMETGGTIGMTFGGLCFGMILIALLNRYGVMRDEQVMQQTNRKYQENTTRPDQAIKTSTYYPSAYDIAVSQARMTVM